MSKISITLNEAELAEAALASVADMINLDDKQTTVTFLTGRGANAGTNATIEITKEDAKSTPSKVKKPTSKKATVTVLPVKEEAEVEEETILEKEVNELPDEPEEVVEEEATDSEEIEDAESLFK